MKKKYKRVFSVIFGCVGMGMLIWVVFPIAKYSAESRMYYPDLLSPVPGGLVFSNENIGDQVDYTKPDNWFPSDHHDEQSVYSGIGFYTISIPDLNIQDATVSIGGEDLSEFLIQYPGTALPGKTGNAVIFGHSILPQYFDPKNYLAIFSTLSRLREGNEIIINYDGITYTYRVKEKFEVKPTDIRVLEQNETGSYISLITCSPPGHPLKPRRLVVKAEIVPTNKLSISS